MTRRWGVRRDTFAAGIAVAVVLGGVPAGTEAVAVDGPAVATAPASSSASLASAPAVEPVSPTGSEVTAVGLAPDPEAAVDPAPDLTEALDLPPTDTGPEDGPTAPEAPGTTPGDDPVGDEPTAADEPAADEPAADEPTAPAAVPAPETVLSASGFASGFAVIGVTWDVESAPDGTTVAVRSRTGADWTDWEPVPVEIDSVDEGDARGAGVRDGTEPFAVGTVDEVEVALNGVDGVNPANPELVIIDPDAHPDGETNVSQAASAGAGDVAADVEDAAWRPSAREAVTDGTATALTTSMPYSVAPVPTSAQRSLATSGAPAAVGSLASAATTPRPQIHSRAAWGADESLMRWAPQIGRVEGAVIHHTVNGNSYTADQVPSIIRGIYTYHAVSRGWGDIGYNVLVDRYGRAWEGRAGGVDRAVIGAHASGWNATRFGVSVIGDFSNTGASAAAVEAVAQVVTWKLSLHGVSAGPSTIVGHRDVGQTACPGAFLYARLADIRAAAAARMGDGSDRNVVHDLTGDGVADLAMRTSSAVTIASRHAGGWETPRQVGNGWTGSQTIAPGDFTGDGIPDLMLRSGGALYLYPGTATGTWAPRQQVSIASLAAMNLVVGGHDWNGDKATDLLARRTSDGTLWLYAGDGRGGVAAPRQVGNGWNTMSVIQMIGKLSDGRPALVARDGSGTLYTYPGNGSGGFGNRIAIGPGWSGMNLLVGVGDMNDDGRVDVVARNTAGDLYLYPGTGTGTVGLGSRIGSGWASFTAVLSAGRGGSGQDIFAVTSAGALLKYGFRGPAPFDRRVGSGVSVAGVVEAITPGDWNGDGRADLITRRSNGDLYLHAGSGSGSYATNGTKIGNGWASMTQVVGGGNWLGTGVPTLIALNRSQGTILLYPGNGRGGFGAPLTLATGAGNVDLIAAPGRWAGGRAPDLITRVAGTGALQLRRGNGGATLGAPVQIGNGWAGMGVAAIGDATGDGRPDLAATSGTTLRIYPGNGAGGFLATRTVGSIPTGAAIS